MSVRMKNLTFFNPIYLPDSPYGDVHRCHYYHPARNVTAHSLSANGADDTEKVLQGTKKRGTKTQSHHQ